MHEYYYKDVATRTVVNARSAMPLKTKRIIITQDLLRILLRCSPNLPWVQVSNHLNHNTMRLQYSGYDQKFRGEVVRSALHAYEILRTKEMR